MSLTSVLGRLRKKDHKFGEGLGYRVSICLLKNCVDSLVLCHETFWKNSTGPGRDHCLL